MKSIQRSLFHSAVAIAIGMGPLSQRAQAQPVGAQFLDNAAPAGVLSMNGAATALVGGAQALFANPAGASLLKGGEVVFTHSSGMEGTQLQSIAYAQTVGFERKSTVKVPTQNGYRTVNSTNRVPITFGASAIYQSYGTFQAYDDSNNQTGTFSPTDLAVAVSAARPIAGRWAAGLSFKGFRQTAGDIQSSGFAGDFGLRGKTRWPQLDVAAALTNVGPSIHSGNDSYVLPTAARLGAAYRLTVADLALDASMPLRNGHTSVGAAVQMHPASSLAVRMSYVADMGGPSGFKADGAGTLARLAGLGVGIGLNISRYSLDYAFVPHEALENTHRISLLAHF
jgi:hypothetical protein